MNQVKLGGGKKEWKWKVSSVERRPKILLELCVKRWLEKKKKKKTRQSEVKRADLLWQVAQGRRCPNRPPERPPPSSSRPSPHPVPHTQYSGLSLSFYPVSEPSCGYSTIPSVPPFPRCLHPLPSTVLYEVDNGYQKMKWIHTKAFQAWELECIVWSGV